MIASFLSLKGSARGDRNTVRKRVPRFFYLFSTPKAQPLSVPKVCFAASFWGRWAAAVESMGKEVRTQTLHLNRGWMSKPGWACVWQLVQKAQAQNTWIAAFVTSLISVLHLQIDTGFYFLKPWTHSFLFLEKGTTKSPEPSPGWIKLAWANPLTHSQAELYKSCVFFLAAQSKRTFPSLHTCLASSEHCAEPNCLPLSVPKRHEGHGGTVGSITCKISFAAHQNQTWSLLTRHQETVLFLSLPQAKWRVYIPLVVKACVQSHGSLWASQLDHAPQPTESLLLRAACSVPVRALFLSIIYISILFEYFYSLWIFPFPFYFTFLFPLVLVPLLGLQEQSSSSSREGDPAMSPMNLGTGGGTWTLPWPPTHKSPQQHLAALSTLIKTALSFPPSSTKLSPPHWRSSFGKYEKMGAARKKNLSVISVIWPFQCGLFLARLGFFSLWWAFG